MLPRFFGDTSRPLFGVYHAATGAPVAGVAAAARRSGVVLCYPGPQEYRQAHWAFRRLAGLLTAAGVHVLRFDYTGTGDSAGESTEGRLAQWVEDVRTAVRELQDVAGVRRTALVGLRLGGSVAARACAAGLAVSDLVLWDPVVRGAEYLAGLDAEQASGLGQRSYPEDDRPVANELLGFAMTPEMRAEVAAVDLTAEACGAPARVLVIGADAGPEYAALGTAYSGRGVRTEVRHVADATLARGGHWTSDTLMARHIPAEIRDFVVRTGGPVPNGATSAEQVPAAHVLTHV